MKNYGTLRNALLEGIAAFLFANVDLIKGNIECEF